MFDLLLNKGINNALIQYSLLYDSSEYTQAIQKNYFLLAEITSNCRTRVGQLRYHKISYLKFSKLINRTSIEEN